METPTTSIEGRRIHSPVLGTATVLQHPYHSGLGHGFAWVQFDAPPPFDYNCGANPALVLLEQFEFAG